MTFSYTLSPVAMPSFDMILFILLSLLISTLLCLIAGFVISESKSDISDRKTGEIFGVIVTLTVIIVFFSIDGNFKRKPIPKNEIVCGKRVDFSTDIVGGKSKSLAGFVQYEMCDGSGIVTLRTEQTRSYPEQLNFYRN